MRRTRGEGKYERCSENSKATGGPAAGLEAGTPMLVCVAAGCSRALGPVSAVALSGPASIRSACTAQSTCSAWDTETAGFPAPACSPSTQCTTAAKEAEAIARRMAKATILIRAGIGFYQLGRMMPMEVTGFHEIFVYRPPNAPQACRSKHPLLP